MPLITLIALFPFATSLPANAAPPTAEAPASTITVNSNLDTTGNVSICTLRDAITAANTNLAAGGCAAGSAYPTMDTINISLSPTYCELHKCNIVLSSPLPVVSEDVTIQGAGAWFPTISGANTYRVFDLGAVAVNISNMNIINGNAVGNAALGYGGAINTSPLDTTLQVSNVVFYGNHAQTRGGAIYVQGGIASISSSSFSDNTVDYYGGAIDQTGGVMIITASTLSGNSAGDGGAIEIQWSSERG